MTFHHTLLQEAMTIFQRQGIQTLTDQQLIRQLDVSQATFKELFNSRDNLLLQAIRYNLENDKVHQLTISDASLNAVEEVIGLLQHGFRQLQHINPLYFSEMVLFYPSAWELYQDFIQDFSRQQVQNILNRGISEGLFQPILNVSVATRMVLGQVSLLMDGDLFPADEFPLHKLYYTLFFNIMRGFCTAKGAALLDEWGAGLANTHTVVEPLIPQEMNSIQSAN
jgi:AcrR family transcriptional regulator